MTVNSEHTKKSSWAGWLLVLALVSSMLGTAVAWRAPGLDLYARDWLMRARGPVPPPTDIVIVAIDEQSIARFGRFPWPRSILARTLTTVAAARPKVIGLDVLFSEPTDKADDAALTGSISRAGNVVSAAQLARSASSEVVWLGPIPTVAQASAGLGHVNVSTELEGVARELAVQEADDAGTAIWAMAVEAVRVADGASKESVRELGGVLRVGSHSIPVRPGSSLAPMQSNTPEGVERLTPQRMTIDYVGPAGSFAPYTFSVADVMDGKVRPAQFEGKYVLIGGTAASLGDRVASPFVHFEQTGERQHGTLMPGVEVLANSLNTVLRSRFYSELPDWLAFLCSVIVCLVAGGALSLGHTRHEAAKHIGVLAILAGAFLVVAYFMFARWLVVPPLVPVLISLATMVPLALVRRAMIASSGLDERVRELAQAEEWQWPSTARSGAGPAAAIAGLTGANAVAIFRREPSADGGQVLVSGYGPDNWKNEPGGLVEQASPNLIVRTLPLGMDATPLGTLSLAHATGNPPSEELLRLCVAISAGYLSGTALRGAPPIEDKRSGMSAIRRLLPHGAEWKSQAIGALQRKLLARARFVDRAMRSVEDGLVVCGPDAEIVFANRRATEIFGVSESSLLGSSIIDRLGEKGQTTQHLLSRLILDRASLEQEIVLGRNPPRHYTLRLSPVVDAGDSSSGVLGVVASLSDITKQHELQQMKTDVMALVTHELRTPLTAIQGISEVLAQFEIDAERRREMHVTINDEAKRLSRLIDEYLDITKLESGARPLRLTPLRIESLVERALVLLDPLADKRDVTLDREFAAHLPPVLADADLLARAVTNLVANAIKYSPPGAKIIVAAKAGKDLVRIDVKDTGPGIPVEHLGRIFDKFYRVPRIEDAEVPGTGLGLAMVREIMEAHGGAVTVTSVAGVGSTFTLRLPLPVQQVSNREGTNDGQ